MKELPKKRKMYPPRRPPMTVHRMVLFTTTRSIHGTIRVATVFRQGSGSDIRLLLKMKNALAPFHAKVKTLIGMEIH